MRRETSAGVVLYRRGKRGRVFLLLHYPSGHWDFIKGRMEQGESPLETAARETKEETGISDVSFVEGFEEWIEYEFMLHGKLVRKSVVFFLAETGTSEVSISDEHVGYTWEDYNTAMTSVTFDNARNVLTRAQMLLVKAGRL